MQIDRRYCSSSYLMFRSIHNENLSFTNLFQPKIMSLKFARDAVRIVDDLINSLRKQMEFATADGKACLALSGGIDSAILAKFMPRGSKAYTFRCIVPGVNVIDETKTAALYAEACGLEHEIIDIYWEDILNYAPVLMLHKGAPIHSIETQIYKAALKAKSDFMTKIIFGENADIIYGGMDGLLAKNWTFGEFIDRYSYIMPYKVLKKYELILEPFIKHEKQGNVDGHEFINDLFRQEALGTYNNACETCGIEFIGPYSNTYLDTQIDYKKIRNGDTKYLVREAFAKLYPNFELPNKIPMPRPMNEWMKGWKGPIRNEFWPNCASNMSGDQKWMVFALELFLNLVDDLEKKEGVKSVD